MVTLAIKTDASHGVRFQIGDEDTSDRIVKSARRVRHEGRESRCVGRANAGKQGQQPLLACG